MKGVSFVYFLKKFQLNFNITFGYNDIECGVEREGPGIYSNEVVIQHHDRIVTSSDLGLSVTCQYDLANKTVANLVDLKLTGEITPSLYEESVVDSPNVLMRVADDQGRTFNRQWFWVSPGFWPKKIWTPYFTPKIALTWKNQCLLIFRPTSPSYWLGGRHWFRQKKCQNEVTSNACQIKTPHRNWLKSENLIKISKI